VGAAQTGEKEAPINVLKYLKRVQRTQIPGSFHWCPVPGEEALGTNCNKRGSVYMSGSVSVLCG